MSTGNANECASGTIGAKVSKGGTIYALSNNHVFARENDASIDETIYQPGRYDPRCKTDDRYAWATLASFQTISFKRGTNNRADVALARVNDPTQLEATTPEDGYGAPSASTTSASIGMSVMKYGRTTGLTTGTVVGIDVMIRVQYSNGIATFVDQIEIRGKGQFSRAGDSGSLIVTWAGPLKPCSEPTRTRCCEYRAWLEQRSGCAAPRRASRCSWCATHRLFGKRFPRHSMAFASSSTRRE